MKDIDIEFLNLSSDLPKKYIYESVVVYNNAGGFISNSFSELAADGYKLVMSRPLFRQIYENAKLVLQERYADEFIFEKEI